MCFYLNLSRRMSLEQDYLHFVQWNKFKMEMNLLQQVIAISRFYNNVVVNWLNLFSEDVKSLVFNEVNLRYI